MIIKYDSQTGQILHAIPEMYEKPLGTMGFVQVFEQGKEYYEEGRIRTLILDPQLSKDYEDPMQPDRNIHTCQIATSLDKKSGHIEDLDHKERLYFQRTDDKLCHLKERVGVQGITMVSKQAFIAEGQSLSAAIDLTGLDVATFVMPNTWNAANLTFQAASTKDGTYFDVYDSDGAELTVSAAASRSITLERTKEESLKHFDFIKVRSGTSGTPVTQNGDRPIVLLCTEEA